jgi:hypothetical protein
VGRANRFRAGLFTIGTTRPERTRSHDRGSAEPRAGDEPIARAHLESRPVVSKQASENWRYSTFGVKINKT